jgi:hypothetical protein
VADENVTAGHSGWKVKLDPTVNFGHIITATTFLVAGAIAYATLESRQGRTEERVVRLERLEEELRRTREAEIARIAEISVTLRTVSGVVEQIDRRVNALLVGQRRTEYEQRP